MRGVGLVADRDWHGSPDADEAPAAKALAQRQQAGLAALAALGAPAYPAGVPAAQPLAFVPGPRGRPAGADRARGDYRPASGQQPSLLRQRLAYALLLAAGLFLAGRFAFFWFNPARLPRDFGPRLDLADIVMFAALNFVVWHRQLLDMCAWLACARLEAYQAAPPPAPGLRVAFITTFVPGSESIEMLRRTLVNIVRADYRHDTWLLDEGNDLRARELCARLGVKYFTRKGIECLNRERGIFLAKSKGGNHNSWYVSHGRHYDFVAQVDSDFLVRRDFLTKTLGYFRNTEIAFVGTPQIYGNMDNLISRGAACQTYLFYGPILRALSRRRMALLIGANHVIRVSALQQIGWYQGHLTEDLATGKRIHAKRWQSVYVPLPLAVGEGPTTWAAYFNQQYRWATGCMDIFFTQSPWLNMRMRRNHGLYYFLLEQYYLSGVTMAVGVVLLMLYYAFGWRAANLQIEQAAYWYVPLLIWRQVIMLWLQRFNVRPAQERGVLWAGRLVTTAAIPIYFLAFIGVVRRKRVTFKTTPKGGSQSQELDSPSVFAPHLAIAALVAAGLGIGILRGHTAWIFMAWGIGIAASFSGFPVHLLGRRLADALRARRRAAWQMTTDSNAQ
jgi:cellulose synthase (UDP-forming)